CVRRGIGYSRVGTTGIPAERERKWDLGCPAQAAGQARVLSPRPPHGDHQRNGILIFCLCGKRSTRAGKSGTKTKTTLRTDESCAGGLWSADFFGASPIASALGIRSGATPRRTIETGYRRNRAPPDATLQRQAVLTIRLHD